MIADVVGARIGSERVFADADMPICAPWDGQILGHVPRCGAGDVDAAVAAARQQLQNVLPAWVRVQILERAAHLLSEPARAEHLAELIALEVAKPIVAARTEVARAASTFAFAATEARKLTGHMVPLDASSEGQGRLGFTLRVPVGVVGAITPFNFPLNLVAHKVAPAIAAGCPVVLKPAHQAPLTGMALADLLLDECGLPAGALNVVTGTGEEAGQPLVDHPDVAMITFTGSPSVGWDIRRRAFKKHVSLELGNNSPVIVQPDCDLEATAARICSGAFGYSGQSCISVQRVLVHRSVSRTIQGLVAERADRLVTGDPTLETTDVSALISADARKRVQALIEDATEHGASVIAGGSTESGHIRPTVMADVNSSMRIAQDEAFGPVLGIMPYATLDEAIQLANATSYGLQAGIFTQDLSAVLSAITRLDFGGVIVNDVPTWRADQMPYGGMGDSGNTREGPAYTVEAMTESRTIVIRDTQLV